MRRAIHWKRRWWLVTCALVLWGMHLPVGHAAEVEEVNPDLAAQLFIKILSYDRNLAARSGGRLVVAIVHRPESPESERIRESMQAAFQDRADKSNILGMQFSVTSVAFDAKLLPKRLQGAGATILYITPGLEDAVGVVSSTAVLLKAPTLTGRRGLLDSGLAIAVVTKDNRPGIVVNLPVAKALGMDLDPNLLRLSEVKR